MRHFSWYLAWSGCLFALILAASLLEGKMMHETFFLVLGLVGLLIGFDTSRQLAGVKHHA